MKGIICLLFVILSVAIAEKLEGFYAAWDPCPACKEGSIGHGVHGGHGLRTARSVVMTPAHYGGWDYSGGYYGGHHLGLGHRVLRSTLGHAGGWYGGHLGSYGHAYGAAMKHGGYGLHHG